MLRLGLCCVFKCEPIKFKKTTVTCISKMSREDGLKKISDIVRHNIQSLFQSVNFCSKNNIGCFRINSSILPIKTHSVLGYSINELPHGDEFVEQFQAVGKIAKDKNIRLCFHPDQFVVLNSPKPEVVESSLAEIEYQAEVAEWIGADVINIHGGGAYGDKESALNRLVEGINQLSDRAKSRLTLENDHNTYTPNDLLPVCKLTGVPLLYDVHHHRCHPDQYDLIEATALVTQTWNREPMFHISSPINGWDGNKTSEHHDFINPLDFPSYWKDLSVTDDLTVEVEAKAKEVAIKKLQESLV